jgi:hypothetical protein
VRTHQSPIRPCKPHENGRRCETGGCVTAKNHQGRRPLITDRIKPEKLVCRYCGNDDLAPSFKQRRDARCRACFKQRYGSAEKDKKTKPVLKAKTTE